MTETRDAGNSDAMAAAGSEPSVDVVIVSYNSRDRLRAAVESLVSLENVDVIVVDNASSDDSLAAIADLPARTFPLERNGGFAVGCNVGWRAGAAPYVLFLNPDARIDQVSLATLVGVLERNERAGAAAPRIMNLEGELDYSIRRFPRLLFTYSHAFFLQRLFPGLPLIDEVRDEEAYARSRPVDWVAGACILVRRTLLEEIGGLDEGFFLYCEDIDLCRRIWDAGYEVWFEPAATCTHEGGASAPRDHALPLLALSRMRYAGKYRGFAGRSAEQIGLVLAAATHALASRGVRRGHVASLKVLVKNGSRDDVRPRA